MIEAPTDETRSIASSGPSRPARLAGDRAVKIAQTDLAMMMARAQDGDNRAYATLLDHCQHWLTRFFARRIAPSQIDDLVQETLISVHRKRATYDPTRPFLPWLAAIARYRWIDQLRKDYRNETVDHSEDFAVESDEEPITARLSIDRLLALLDPAQAQAITLVKIDGLTSSEAASRSGQSESLIRVNIHRGLKKLAAIVESE